MKKVKKKIFWWSVIFYLILNFGLADMQSQLVCSGCRTVLLYPSGATNVCCAICNMVTSVPPAGNACYSSFLCLLATYFHIWSHWILYRAALTWKLTKNFEFWLNFKLWNQFWFPFFSITQHKSIIHEKMSIIHNMMIQCHNFKLSV